MYPHIGSLRTYGLLYLGAIAAHFVVGALTARRLRLRWYVWLTISLSFLLAMTVGAKALSDLRAGSFELAKLFSAAHYMRGGLWGGLVVYFALAVPLACLTATDRRAAIDLVALTLPLPLIMAKLGCLAEGCCFGKPCAWPWAITFSASDDAPIGTPLHPTQIYEILVLAVIWSAFRLLPADRWRGTILAWFVLLYGVGRSLVETFRGDTTVQPRALGLSDSQLIMLAGVVIALVVLMAKRKPPAAPTDPPATP